MSLLNKTKSNTLFAKGLVAKPTSPHAQNAWVSREERIRIVGFAAYCNYL